MQPQATVVYPSASCAVLYCVLQPAGSDGGGDVVHFAYCDYIHLLGVTITGQTGDSMPHETLKVVGMICRGRQLMDV